MIESGVRKAGGRTTPLREYSGMMPSIKLSILEIDDGGLMDEVWEEEERPYLSMILTSTV
jgi:hypothetical protein